MVVFFPGPIPEPIADMLKNVVSLLESLKSPNAISTAWSPIRSRVPTTANTSPLRLISNAIMLFLQNVCCDTSRDVEVKLVGERIGSSGLASTTCSALGSLQRGERAGTYEDPPGCPEDSDWTQREIFTFISHGNHAANPGKSESLMPNAANRRFSISSRRSESRMYRIGPVSLSRMAPCIAGTKFMRSRGWEDRRPEAS